MAKFKIIGVKNVAGGNPGVVIEIDDEELNQITRNDALRILAQNPYSSSAQLNEDKEYFLKKMNWNESMLIKYINRPPKSHMNYPNSKYMYKILLKIYKLLKSSD